MMENIYTSFKLENQQKINKKYLYQLNTTKLIVKRLNLLITSLFPRRNKVTYNFINTYIVEIGRSSLIFGSSVLYITSNDLEHRFLDAITWETLWVF